MSSETMMSVRVLVAGAAGRMGREVLRAVLGDPETGLVAAVDVTGIGQDAGELAGRPPAGITVQADLEAAIRAAGPEVMVDFTRAEAAYRNALTALGAGVSPVIGTTGMTQKQIAGIGQAAKEAGVGAVVAPNFAIGAVLMMLFAAQAARYLPDVEIIELHHERKADAPSGTAIKTAEMIAEARTLPGAPRPEQEMKIPGARGGELNGITIHSVRLPGLVAHQEVIFGGLGQTLSIRHDSLDRTSFMPGVLLAVKAVRSRTGLVYGLEHLL
jgi:4-hydroxy-tetrahydrodipicolinate reductase